MPDRPVSNPSQAKADFAKAIKLAGLLLEGDPIMDGAFHRLPVADGKASAKDGTYVGFLDGRPSGHIQNFRTGHKETWTTEGPQLSGDERWIFTAQIQLAKERRAVELVRQHRESADRVAARWDRLAEAPDTGTNAYLSRKGVEAFGVRFDRDVLVVPARDIDGRLWSLQSIAPGEGGVKRFEKGARKAGTLHVIGELRPGSEILVAEGYATAASLHHASGKAVVVAFDAGNLDAVIGSLRQRYPTSPIVVMGDDDRHRHPNVGVEKATAAARRHGVGVAFPKFRIDGRGTDFNDLHAIEGLPAVKAQVEIALNQPLTPNLDRSAAPAPAPTPQAPNAKPAGERPAEPAPTRFNVALVDREGKPVEQFRTNDAAAAVTSFAKQAESPFGQTQGRGSYAALTDNEGRLGAAKVYEGFAVYNMRFSTDEGRAAYEAVVPSPPSVQYPVDRLGAVDTPTQPPHRDDAATKVRPEAGRLTPRDVVVGAAHVTQLAQVGSSIVQTAAKAVGVADAVKVGVDVVQGKDVRAIDVAAAAASVTLSEGVAEPTVQVAAQAVAAVSALDAGRRAANSFDDKSFPSPTAMQADAIVQRNAEPLVSPANPATSVATPEQREAAIAWARETSKQFGEQLRREQTEGLQAINRGNAETAPVPRDAVTRAEANAWVAADLVSLQSINDPALRREAGNTMGFNAQEQSQYKAALVAQSPEVATEVARSFREIQQVWLDSARREPWEQDFEANQIAARYSQLKAEQRTVADLTPEKIERLASEDFRSLAVLRGQPAEADAKALASESLKNIAYRSAFEREATEASRIDVALLVGSRGDASAIETAAARPGQLPRNTIEYVDPRSPDVETPETAALRPRLLGQLSVADPRATGATLLSAAVEPDLRSPAPGVRSARENIRTEPDAASVRTSVPPLEDRFNVIQHLDRREYQFRDQPGRVAFTERWLSMQSTVDTPAVVKAMVDRAQERGWTSLRVKGAPEFERQAWIAATARDIKAVGYQPTDLDRAAANEERARLARERDAAPTKSGGTITRESERDRTVATPAEPAPQREAQTGRASETRVAAAPVARPLSALLAQRGDSPSDVESIVAAATELVKGKRFHVGQVVNHGAADYKFDSKNEPSYYVNLRAPDGDKTVWGVDLKRALAENRIQAGDNVVLENRGKQPVTVETKEYDAAGRYVGQRSIDTERNTWFAAGVDQLREKAALARSGVEQQPSDPQSAQVVLPLQPVRNEPSVSPPAPPVATTQAVRPSHAQGPKPFDAQVFAVLEASFELQKVPEALRARLRDDVTRGLSQRQSLGEATRVKVYDPEAARAIPRAVIPPQRERETLDRSR